MTESTGRPCAPAPRRRTGDPALREFAVEMRLTYATTVWVEAPDAGTARELAEEGQCDDHGHRELVLRCVERVREA